jgi:HK97 family phage major capsid protein
MPSEAQQAVDDLQTAFHQFKDANDQRLDQLEDKGAEDVVTAEKVDRINADLSTLSSLVKDLETKANRPAASNEESPVAEEVAAHKKAFEAFVREPKNLQLEADSQAAYKALQVRRRELGLKAVDTLTAAAGGSAVPEDIDQNIMSRLRDISPMRQDALVEVRGTSDVKKLITLGASSGGWVGETDARSDTATATLYEAIPTFGMVYAYPKATEESLTDMFFDVLKWLEDDIVDSFAEDEGVAYVSGNGTKKATGFLAGTPVLTADATRAAGVLQYYATGVAADFAAGAGGSSDLLKDVVYGLKARHRANAKWRMNSVVIGTVRKWKDGNGNYLWAPGLVAGQPSTLDGYPVSEDEAMPVVGANAFPIAFGDWARGYWIVDLMSLAITRDEITTPGYVKFYARKRTGGGVLDDRAIKLIKCEL